MEIKYKAIPDNAIKIEVPDTRQGKDYTCRASALRGSLCLLWSRPRGRTRLCEDMKMGRGGSDPEKIIMAEKK
jgi:hypothetical protein